MEPRINADERRYSYVIASGARQSVFSHHGEPEGTEAKSGGDGQNAEDGPNTDYHWATADERG